MGDIDRRLNELAEKIMYLIRPLKFCKGIGCYVMTPSREKGVPFCRACRDEGNEVSV